MQARYEVTAAAVLAAHASRSSRPRLRDRQNAIIRDHLPNR